MNKNLLNGVRFIFLLLLLGSSVQSFAIIGVVAGVGVTVSDCTECKSYCSSSEGAAVKACTPLTNDLASVKSTEKTSGYECRCN